MSRQQECKKKTPKQKECPLPRTRLGQVARVSTEAICTDADKWIVPDSRHTRSPIVAEIHLTVVTWGNKDRLLNASTVEMSGIQVYTIQCN